MDDGGRGTDVTGGGFDGIDSDLTVFALANGVDLAKSEGVRRLEWFSEGLERGVVIEAGDGGTFTVVAMTWRSGRPELRAESRVSEGLSPAELRRALPDAIETANGLDAPEG